MSVQTRIDTKQQTVRQVLNTDFRYIVPAHQRDFAWRADEEVKQLWDDILDAMAQRRPDYFLGTIVVTENAEDKTRSVIDGQQRLAVLTMILSAIRSVYREHSDERENEVYTEYLGVRDRRTRMTEPRLTLNRTNQSAFQDMVVQDAEDDEVGRALRGKRKGSSDELLLQSAQLIRGLVSGRSQMGKNYADFLLDLEDFVADKVVLILVAVGDEADAYLIFETLNDRGLDLSISDLLKNYIYSRAGNRLAAVQRQWEEMTFLLGSQDATQFLRHYWLSTYGVVRERELYKELRGKFQARQHILSLMTELRDAADKYAAMSNVDHAIWAGYSTQLRKDLETLQLFGLSQFRPLLLAALDRMDDQHQIERVVRMIVVISMRYSIVGSLTPSAIEKAYSDAAISIRQGKADTSAKVFDGLKGVYPDDERFRNDFEAKVVTKAKLARYLLSHLANEMQPAKSLEVIQDEQRVTLEHIMPKTPSGDWKSAARDEDEYVAFVDRIGNLTLLERDVNHAAGNAAFSEKKSRAFANSDLKLTKDICDYSSWTTSEIADRQRRLAETAAEVWAITV